MSKPRDMNSLRGGEASSCAYPKGFLYEGLGFVLLTVALGTVGFLLVLMGLN
jgi:hypothetical protein